MADQAQNHLRIGLTRYFKPEQLTALANTRVGIAGAGGLGSNTAMLLARSGIENFLIIDHDVIEASNLNRQHYWPDQLGMAKVDALAEHLYSLNSDLNLEISKEKLDYANLPMIVAKAPIWVEALDGAAAKKMFVEAALLSGAKVASASGLAGFGREPMRKRRLGNLVIVGDYTSDIGAAPPLAPRVAQAAALMADSVLEFILAV